MGLKNVGLLEEKIVIQSAESGQIGRLPGAAMCITRWWVRFFMSYLAETAR